MALAVLKESVIFKQEVTARGIQTQARTLPDGTTRQGRKGVLTSSSTEGTDLRYKKEVS